MGEPEEAIDDFTAALEQEPDNVKFLYDRGQCYRSIGLADKAEEDLTKVRDFQKRRSSSAEIRAFNHSI